MPSLPSDSAWRALEAENQALRAENQRLQTERADAAALHPLTARYHQSQARFHTVFDHSPLGHKIIAPDLTIRQANAALASCSASTTRPRWWAGASSSLPTPHRYDWHLLQQQLWIHHLPFFRLETCLQRVDSSSFWCRVTSVLFPDEGGELGYTTLEDISARKALEEQLHTLYQGQETVLHLIVHDLKTPLNHIRMLGQLLQQTTATNTEEVRADTARYLELIAQAWAQANALLKDVLYIGRLDTLPLVKQRLALGALVRVQADRNHAPAKLVGV